MRIDPIRPAARPAHCAIRRASRRPWLQLIDAVMTLAGGGAELLRHAESGWASVTFAGTRHRLVLAFAGAEPVAAAERFIVALPDHEFAIPRQLVADAIVVSVEHSLLPAPRLVVEIELLLLEDA
jgi:hypothetical protein